MVHHPGVFSEAWTMVGALRLVDAGQRAVLPHVHCIHELTGDAFTIRSACTVLPGLRFINAGVEETVRPSRLASWTLSRTVV